MYLERVKDSFDAFKAEFSMAEVRAIVDALSQCGADIVQDELSQAFAWYLDRLPAPGEDEKTDDERDLEADDSLEPGYSEPPIAPRVDPQVDGPPAPPEDAELVPADLDLDAELPAPDGEV